MEINRKIRLLCISALAESMDIHTMIIVARKLFGKYDIYQRTGFPKSLAIPNRDVAAQIVTDIIESNLFLNFANLLVEFQDSGHMGRKIPILPLREIIKVIYSNGYQYDKDNRMFIENPQIRKTKNWGALSQNENYNFTFIYIDIVKNTKLVRNYSAKHIKTAYNNLRKIVQESVDKRNGRIWEWEGDGGLLAFHFGESAALAVASAMEINHNLFIYNKLYNKIAEDIKVRIAVHSGHCDFSFKNEIVQKNETIKRLDDAAKFHTAPDSITITEPVKVMLDTVMSKQFILLKDSEHGAYYNYSLKWKNA